MYGLTGFQETPDTYFILMRSLAPTRTVHKFQIVYVRKTNTTMMQNVPNIVSTIPILVSIRVWPSSYLFLSSSIILHPCHTKPIEVLVLLNIFVPLPIPRQRLNSTCTPYLILYHILFLVGHLQSLLNIVKRGKMI